MREINDEVLLFELAGERYALPGAAVLELVRAVWITPLPQPARFITGVLDLRGQIVPVIDLRACLGLPAKPLDTSDHFLVVRTAQRPMVLPVDRALELVRMDAKSLDTDASHTSSGPGTRVAKYHGGLCILLDLETLLSQKSVAPLEAIPGAVDGGTP